MLKTINRILGPAVAAAIALAGAPGAQAAQQPTTSACRPVPVAETHGKGFESFCRLAYIDHGTVPCVSINAGKPRKCRFTSSSGAWLESTTGALYALAGQPISLRGNRGGAYVIASKASLKDPPPCMQDPKHAKAQASDLAGASRSMELAGVCTLEIVGSTKNATGLGMDNYATKPVCSTTHDSPDQVSGWPTPSPEPGVVWCYQGEGAGLNDPNGTERDSSNWYMTGSKRCHVIMANGYEVYASKRPATKGYPARVDIHSPIVWRPVAQNVSIAN